MTEAAFIYDDALSRHELRQDHPMRPVRLRYTYELLESYGAFDGKTSRLVNPRTANEEELGWVHTPEYIDAVRRLSENPSGSLESSGSPETVGRPERFGFSDRGDNPVYPGMYHAASLSSGATLVAAEMVAERRADVAFSISGGLHHAAPTHASGFCIFNDPAIAIRYFLDRGMRVAYVDVDAHHGDGVQDIFYRDDRVLTISIHESGQYLFPGTGFVTESGAGNGAGYSVNIPLYPYTEDELYLWAFREVAPPLLRAFAPDVLVTQLGIDSYHSDPITHLNLTSRGYTEIIREFARLEIPWLALGGGGYDVGAVARCWSLAYGVMLGVDWPDRVPDNFANRFDGQHNRRNLRDTVALDVPAEVRLEARRQVEEAVAAIKGEIFVRHGIK